MNTRGILARIYLALSSVALGFSLFFYSSLSSAVTVSIVPAEPSVFVGDTISLQAVISDLGDGVAPSLSAYDFTISYSTPLAGFQTITFGDPAQNQLNLLGYGSINYFDDSTSGTLLFGEVSLDDPDTLNNQQLPGFVLATFQFSTSSLGNASFVIQDATLVDANGDLITIDTLNDTAMVGVTSVPEPNPSVLFLSGIVLLTVIARSRISV